MQELIYLEQSILRKIIENPEAFVQTVHELNDRYFNNLFHRKLIERIRDVFNKYKENIDCVLLQNELSKFVNNLNTTEIQEMEFVLMKPLIDEQKVKAYLELLGEHFLKNQLQKIAANMSELCNSKSYVNRKEIEPFIKRLDALYTTKYSSEIHDISDLFQEFLSERNSNSRPYIKTGWNNFNKNFLGIYRGCITVVGARPGMGITAFLCNLLLNTVDESELNYMIQIGESNKGIVSLMMSLISGISVSEINNNECMSEKNISLLKEAETTIQKMNLDIVFVSTLSLYELESMIRSKAIQYKIKMLIVGKIQYVYLENKSKYMTRDREIGIIMQSLKALAIELNICLILGSHVSRSAERRGNLMPILSDLRDSGYIEEFASLVLFLNRPEAYGIFEMEDGSSSNEKLIVTVSKNENGGSGNCLLRYQLLSQSVTDFIDENPYEPETNFYNKDTFLKLINDSNEFENKTPFQ